MTDKVFFLPEEDLSIPTSNCKEISVFQSSLYKQMHIFHPLAGFLRFVKYVLFYHVFSDCDFFHSNVFAPFYEEALARQPYYIIPGRHLPL